MGLESPDEIGIRLREAQIRLEDLLMGMKPVVELCSAQDQEGGNEREDELPGETRRPRGFPGFTHSRKRNGSRPASAGLGRQPAMAENGAVMPASPRYSRAPGLLLGVLAICTLGALVYSNSLDAVFV